MDALVLTRTGSEKPLLKLERRDIPVARPGSGEVLVKIRASKLNPSDALNIKGGFPYTTFPRVPGRDYAGYVVSAPDHPKLEGQRVFGTSGNRLGFDHDGAQAEYMLSHAEWLVPMPDCLSYPEAACLGVVYSTALLMITRAHLEDCSQREFKALIVGQSGNVGSTIAQILSIKYPRVKIVAANRHNSRIDFDFDEKFDVVFSTVPSTRALQDLLNSKILAKGAKIVFIATTRPESEPLCIDPLSFYRQDFSLIGVNSINLSLHEARNLMSDISDMFSAGHLSPPKLNDYRQVSLSEGVAAYEQYSAKNHDIIFVMPDNQA